MIKTYLSNMVESQSYYLDSNSRASLWNRGPLKDLKGIKLILDDQGNRLDSYNQFGIIQVLQRSPRNFVFAISYSKLALELLSK